MKVPYKTHIWKNKMAAELKFLAIFWRNIAILTKQVRATYPGLSNFNSKKTNKNGRTGSKYKKKRMWVQPSEISNSWTWFF